MPLSEKERQDLRDERKDPRKAYAACVEHMYFGPNSLKTSKPKPGCKMCWLVYFLHDLASVPPAQREERLEELEEVIHKLNEHVENGTWDYTPYKHPEISIDKDAHQA